jgi:hypothetical protein
MMNKEKLFDLKEALEIAGWSIINENEMFSAADDKIEWLLVNERTFNKETYTFHLFNDLGKRTEKISDILYARRTKDNIKLYFDQDKNCWKKELKKFVYSTI